MADLTKIKNPKLKNLAEGFKKGADKYFGPVLEGLGAVGGMVQAFNKNAAVDSSAQEQQLADIQNQPLGANSRESFLAQNIQYADPNISPKDLQSETVGGKLMNTLTTGVQGALAGSKFDPLLGTIIGGIAGLGAGIGGWIKGDTDAWNKSVELKKKINRINSNIYANQTNTSQSFDIEDTADYLRSHISKYGGFLFGNGGNIHIKEKNKGKFTEAAKRANMGVQEYASKILANKSKYSPELVKRANFARNAAGWHHADGGYLDSNLFPMSTHGSDFTTGVRYINTGKTHEENPNSGVQMGIAADGLPNFVEEGEVVYNDYVFSNRLSPTKKQLKDNALPEKYENKSFAEIARLFARESSERPNDPISKAGLEVSMNKLEYLQEETKMIIDMKRANASIGNMTPMEQLEMASLAAGAEPGLNEQMASMEGAPQPEQPMMGDSGMMDEYGSAEEAAMQEMVDQQGMPAPQQPIMEGEEGTYALGGHLFGEGDKITQFQEYGNDKSKSANEADTWVMYVKPAILELIKNHDGVNSELVKKFNGIQEAYKNARQFYYSGNKEEAVVALQKAFQDAGLNKYFTELYTKLKPRGSTGDNSKSGWIDGFFGPQTAVRQGGSTEYSTKPDKDITRAALARGLEYGLIPDTDLKYSVGDKEYSLYGLYNMLPEKEPPKDIARSLKKPEPAGYEEYINKIKGVSETNESDGLNTWMRYLPAAGNALAFLFNKKDYSDIDAFAEQTANPREVSFTPISERIQPNYISPWELVNPITQMAAATNRQITNNAAGNRSTAIAGMVANDANMLGKIGEALTKGKDYNATQAKQAAEFNRGTSQYNSEGALQADTTNMGLNNYFFERANRIYDLRNTLDTSYNTARSTNLNSFFNSLAGMGRENYIHNQLNDNQSLLYGVDPYTGKSFLKVGDTTIPIEKV